MNIVSRYIFMSILKTQISIFGVLMLIFMSQSLIQFIKMVSKGSIPTELLATLLSLAIPSMANFMLPLSIFLAILFTIGSFCSQSEMVVFSSCGYSRRNLLSITFFLALISAFANGVCTMYLAPWCEAKQIEIIERAKSDPTLFALDSGRFLKMMNNVIYIEDLEAPNKENAKAKDNIMHQIYILSVSDGKNPTSATIANKGAINVDENDLLWLTLYDGTRYEGITRDNLEHRVSNFSEYTALVSDSKVGVNSKKINAKTNAELKRDGTPADLAELQWRYVQPLGVLILSLLVVPLSMVNPRQGRFAKFLPAIGIYLSFYLFSFGIKASAARGNFPLIPGVVLVPICYMLFLAIPINLTETEFFNKFRAKKLGRKLKDKTVENKQ